MRRKLPASSRLPVNFGNEPVCPVPIQRRRASAVPRFIVQNGKLELQTRISNPLLPRRSEAEMNRRSKAGFTLVEILVVLVLLSLIVFALMAVFGGIQRAFKASLTQTDTLEGGRAVMDLIVSDLATMTPSDWESNVPPIVLPYPNNDAPVNFFAVEQAFGLQSPAPPLLQPLVSSPSGQMRTNILESIFVLGKGNINGVPSWIGAGYSVNSNLPDGTLYPLYRFYMTTNASAGPAGEARLFDQFDQYQYTNSTEWSHLMDGVVNLTARVYDTNGVWMTNGYANLNAFHVRWVRFNPDLGGVTDSVFYSNAVPASVQIELGTIEDRTLQHAEGLSGVNQSNYLSNAIGQVHIFRQRVWIRNLDLTAYQ